MIKRRSVRIKVFQAAYGFEHGDGLPLKHFDNTLRERILSVREIFIYNLLIIERLAAMIEQEADNRSTKYLQTDEDRNFNTKLLSNSFIQLLGANDDLQHEIKRLKLSDQLDEALMVNWYRDLKSAEIYRGYLESGNEFDIGEDLDFIRAMFRQFLLENEDFHQHLQDYYSNWIDDAGFIATSLLQCIEKSKHKLSLPYEKDNYDSKMEELLEFGSDLLRFTVNGREQQLKLISTKLKNWDIERLASTDIIILRMALAELLNFPSIPTKVTINEYIDIAREYSTPKSKDFVNGILDNLTRELKDKGLILKEGRGLKES